MKICTHCGQEKFEHEFYKNSAKTDYLSSWCKSCTDADNLRRHHETVEKAPRQRKAIEIDGQLLCNYCLTFKSKTDFHRNKTTRTGYSTKCKQCHKEQYG